MATYNWDKLTTRSYSPSQALSPVRWNNSSVGRSKSRFHYFHCGLFPVDRVYDTASSRQAGTAGGGREGSRRQGRVLSRSSTSNFLSPAADDYDPNYYVFMAHFGPNLMQGRSDIFAVFVE